MVVANQWYWVYATSDAALFIYAVREHELSIGDLRLLHTTQCVAVESVAIHRKSNALHALHGVLQQSPASS